MVRRFFFITFYISLLTCSANNNNNFKLRLCRGQFRHFFFNILNRHTICHFVLKNVSLLHFNILIQWLTSFCLGCVLLIFFQSKCISLMTRKTLTRFDINKQAVIVFREIPSEIWSALRGDCTWADRQVSLATIKADFELKIEILVIAKEKARREICFDKRNGDGMSESDERKNDKY